MVEQSRRRQNAVFDPNEIAPDTRASNLQGLSLVGDEGSLSSPADQRLSEQVLRFLRGTGYPCLRQLTAFSLDGVVTLKGRVSSYYLKQVVHSAVRELPGVAEVRDYVEVSDQE
jgi:BON domain-containing protein